MEQNLVSLQDMQARFEGVKEELEIECEQTMTITISVYRGQKVDGSAPPLYCHIQFENDYYADLMIMDDKDRLADTLEDVSAAFDIPLDAKIWNISIDDEDE